MTEIRTGANAFFIGESQYGAPAVITFVPSGDGRITIDRTYVSDTLRGQGIGLRLVRKTVEYARANNLKIMPKCSFAQKILTGSPDYEDVLWKEVDS